jgi:hypothetical protein
MPECAPAKADFASGRKHRRLDPAARHRLEGSLSARRPAGSNLLHFGPLADQAASLFRPPVPVSVPSAGEANGAVRPRGRAGCSARAVGVLNHGRTRIELDAGPGQVRAGRPLGAGEIAGSRLGVAPRDHRRRAPKGRNGRQSQTSRARDRIRMTRIFRSTIHAGERRAPEEDRHHGLEPRPGDQVRRGAARGGAIRPRPGHPGEGPRAELLAKQ